MMFGANVVKSLINIKMMNLCIKGLMRLFPRLWLNIQVIQLLLVVPVLEIGKTNLVALVSLSPTFFADAGMVCVCRLTPKMLKLWKEKYGTQAFSGMAIFEASKDISVEFDESDKNWTVVNIKDNKTQAIISSMDSDFYEEEEDYEL